MLNGVVFGSRLHSGAVSKLDCEQSLILFAKLLHASGELSREKRWFAIALDEIRTKPENRPKKVFLF